MTSVIVVCAFGVVGLLWLNGRYWRSQWTSMSRVAVHTREGTETEKSKRIVVLWTGAFNTADIHYERLIDLFLQVGDVYVVNYAKNRFDSATSDDVLFKYVMERRPEEIICVGASLGGEQMLRFMERVQKVRWYWPKLRQIATGVPLGGRHLPNPKVALWLMKYLRIGPVWNMLFRWVTHLAFRPLKESEMNGVDSDQLKRHMQAMWSVKPSAMVEQVAAMVKQPPFKAVKDIPTVILDCEKEKIIKGAEAVQEWKKLLDKWLWEVIRVPGGHVQFVERHNDWRWAFATALRKLGYNVK